MRNPIIKFVLPLGAVGLLVFAVLFVSGQDRSTPPAEPAVPPPQSPFDYTVAGAGIVEAETENISIGSPTPGVVTQVLVKVDQHVEAGDPLFKLDDRMLQSELRTRQARLAARKADLTKLENQPRPEELRASKASLSEARANHAREQDLYRRAKELFDRKVETAENLMVRQQAFLAAEAQLARAQAQYDMLEIGAWEYDLEIARAAVQQAEAEVQQTEVELDRLIVRALVSGRVLQVNVRPGEFVGAPPGQPLIVLGSIEKLHVRVDIDENDIPRYQPGTGGVALVRGQSGIEFPLTFVRVEPFVVPKRSLTGDNTERVDTRVLQVIYSIDSKGQPLYVGQQLDVYLKADESSAIAPAAAPASGEQAAIR
jgi:HlyD family secretion protein